MVRISAFFFAASVIGSSLVSAIEVRDSTTDGISDVANTFFKHINIYYTDKPLTIGKNILSGDVDFNFSPIPVEVTIDAFSATGILGKVIYFNVNHTFPGPGLIVPPSATSNSGLIDKFYVNEDLKKIFGSPVINVENIVIHARAPTVHGAGGVSHTFNGNQAGVPISFHKK